MMDINAIIMGLWLSSSLFYWGALVFGVANIGVAIYLIVSNWQATTITFYHWVATTKQLVRR